MVEPAEIIRVPLHCPLQETWRGSLAVIGNLDGVHLGHQTLVREGVRLAAAVDAPPAVVVFEPHPRKVFQPQTPPFQLTCTHTKAEILGSLGVERLFVLPFIEALYTQTPETFVKHTLSEIMGLVGMVTGTDFKFGAGRAGDVDALARLAEEAGMQAHAITPVIAEDGEKYSSSGIRHALQEGNPEEAARMLGRPFLVRGEVVPGRKLARSLDFPTANIPLGDYVRPKYGVYAARLIHQGETLPGIVNIGMRPTVDGTKELLEAHVFDQQIDLYGQTVDVELLHFVRPEQKFDGIDALKAQIEKDAVAVRAWHVAHPA